MPELPEVESVRRSLLRGLPRGAQLEKINFYRKDLRFPIPVKKMQMLPGSEFLGLSRRGKYLLFEFSTGILISHLGMTGQWALSHTEEETSKHDHVRLEFNGPVFLTYNDPRRFGYLEFAKDKKELTQLALFSHLGVEPLSRAFSVGYLESRSKGVSRVVKVFLMDQEIVVGIGNIYASEVLFAARVLPQKKARELTRVQWKKVVNATHAILKKAIQAGGSSIRDYRKADGQEGDFQKQHKVYGREGKPCCICSTKIRAEVIGGRATYWCPRCQK